MDPVTGLSLGRIAAGSVALARPAVIGKVFGLDAEANPQALYVARLFASREVALGALTLLARGKARRTLVAAGIAVDVADAFTAVAGMQDKTVSARSAASLLGPALGAVAAGVGGLRSRP
jgi:hypothetical protein